MAGISPDMFVDFESCQQALVSGDTFDCTLYPSAGRHTLQVTFSTELKLNTPIGYTGQIMLPVTLPTWSMSRMKAVAFPDTFP